MMERALNIESTCFFVSKIDERFLARVLVLLVPKHIRTSLAGLDLFFGMIYET